MNNKGIISGFIGIMLLGSFILGTYLLNGISDEENMNILADSLALKTRMDSLNAYVELDQSVARGWLNYIKNTISTEDDCSTTAYPHIESYIDTSIASATSSLTQIGVCTITIGRVNATQPSGVPKINIEANVNCRTENDKITMEYNNTYRYFKHLELTLSEDSSTCTVAILDNSDYKDEELEIILN